MSDPASAAGNESHVSLASKRSLSSTSKYRSDRVTCNILEVTMEQDDFFHQDPSTEKGKRKGTVVLNQDCDNAEPSISLRSPSAPPLYCYNGLHSPIKSLPPIRSFRSLEYFGSQSLQQQFQTLQKELEVVMNAQNIEWEKFQLQLAGLNRQKHAVLVGLKSEIHGLQKDLEMTLKDLKWTMEQGKKHREFYECYGKLDMENLLALQDVEAEGEPAAVRIRRRNSSLEEKNRCLSKEVECLKRELKQHSMEHQKKRVIALRHALLDEIHYTQSLKSKSISLRKNMSPNVLTILALVGKTELCEQRRLDIIGDVVKVMLKEMQADMVTPSLFVREYLTANILNPEPGPVTKGSVNIEVPYDEDDLLVNYLEEKALERLEEMRLGNWKRSREESESEEGSDSPRRQRRHN